VSMLTLGRIIVVGRTYQDFQTYMQMFHSWEGKMVKSSTHMVTEYVHLSFLQLSHQYELQHVCHWEQHPVHKMHHKLL